MNKPVNVGIPYTNEEERKLAIAQAERLGYKEWEDNDEMRHSKDNIIYIGDDGLWSDESMLTEIIPLERPEESERPKTTSSIENFGEPKVDYSKFPHDLTQKIEVKNLLYFSQDDLTTSEVPVLTFQKGDLLGNQLSVFSIDPEKYERMDKEDGTIILKPKKKKVKVWIEVYEEDGKVKSRMSYSKDELEHYKAGEGYYAGMKHLEVIEREYEV